jgi:hypothetical protein
VAGDTARVVAPLAGGGRAGQQGVDVDSPVPRPQLPRSSPAAIDRPTSAIPLFTDMSKPRRLWELAGGAALTGAVCGLLLGLTWWAYLIGVLISTVGGHPRAPSTAPSPARSPAAP